MKRILCLCSMLVGLLVAGNVSGYSLPLGLDTGNSAISGYPTPYASVDISLVNSTTADVTFTAYVQGSNNYLLGGVNVADLNVNATSFTVGSFSSPTLSDNGSGNVSDFGIFNLTLRNTDGLQDALTSLSFRLTDTSGTWGSATEVLSLNDAGHLAAAHIFVWDGTFTEGRNPRRTDAQITGFATDGTTPVPEPGTILLLGGGLLGLGFYGRRRMKA